MFGMLLTPMRAFGSAFVTVSSACRNCAWSVATGVIAASLEAQTSFAPIRIVTSSTPCEPAALTCAFRSTIFAPVFASLRFLPEISGFFARIRRYTLLTEELVPVDHEFATQSMNGKAHVLNARVIESPVEAIELG